MYLSYSFYDFRALSWIVRFSTPLFLSLPFSSFSSTTLTPFLWLAITVQTTAAFRPCFIVCDVFIVPRMYKAVFFIDHGIPSIAVFCAQFFAETECCVRTPQTAWTHALLMQISCSIFFLEPFCAFRDNMSWKTSNIWLSLVGLFLCLSAWT